MPEFNIASPIFEKMITLILDKHDQMMPFITGFFALMLVVGIILYLYKMISSDDDNAVFPYKNIFFGFVLSVFLFMIVGNIFKYIIILNNFLADFILSTDKSLSFYEIAISSQKESIGSKFNFFNIDFDGLCAYIVIYIADIAFYLLNIWGTILILVLLLFSPVVFAKAQLPSHGIGSVGKFFVDVNQIAFWVPLKSGLDFVFASMYQLPEFSDYFMNGSTPAIVLIICYVAGIIVIPTIASKIVGGNNYNSPLAVAAFAASQIPRLATNLIQLGKLMSSIKMPKFGGGTGGGTGLGPNSLNSPGTKGLPDSKGLLK